MVEEIKSLVLYDEESGSTPLEIVLSNPIKTDQVATQIYRLITKELTDKGFQVTGLVKTGELEYGLTLLKNKKTKTYKLSRKVVTEESKSTELIFGNISLKDEKKKLKDLPFHEIVGIIKEYEERPIKETLSLDDLLEVQHIDSYTEEISKRNTSIEKSLRDNKVSDKSIIHVLWLLENTRSV